jgi:hypothetical protein
MMRRPPVKLFFDCIRMLLRFPETVGVVSTLIITFPAEFVPMRPLVCASCKSRKSTLPCVGSARDQKSQPSKKLAPALVSTRVQGEVGVGTGLPPEVVGVEVGVGRRETEEGEMMEETMTGFPPTVGTGVDDVGFCISLGLLATQ